MLVLGRKPHEVIRLEYHGTTVRLIVVGIRGNKVQLGIEAPREIAIHRDDIKHVPPGVEQSAR